VTSSLPNESRIPDIEKQIPGAIILYNDRVIPADQVVVVTTSNPPQREAAVRFIEHIMSPPIQKLIAEKYGFRPGTVVDVQGPVFAPGYCTQSESYPG
jgi:hypothetical protein